MKTINATYQQATNVHKHTHTEGRRRISMFSGLYIAYLKQDRDTRCAFGYFIESRKPRQPLAIEQTIVDHEIMQEKEKLCDKGQATIQIVNSRTEPSQNHRSTA